MHGAAARPSRAKVPPVIVTRTGPSEADELIGQRCGDSYMITALLGEGGMGAVYLATSEALAGKLAAVKVLLPELIRRANSLARFRAEVYAAGKIDDPNIVRVFDTGELRGGRAYMLMEYCPGGSLEALLKQRGPLPFELILTVLSPIGSALETAHTDAKITHRDIKPANILLVMENLANNPGGGISMAGGTLTVSQSEIGQNTGGGIQMSAEGVVTLTNNLVHHNGDELTSPFGALSLRPASGSVVRFNTIIDNHANTGTASAGGVFCDVPGFVASDNIIFATREGRP